MDQTSINIELARIVKEWVLADNQLKQVNEQARKIRALKNDLTDQLVEHMEKNNMKSNKIKLQDGELRFYDKREVSTLSFGYIEECLTKLILDKDKVNSILNYLHENREVSYVTDIKRVLN